MARKWGYWRDGEISKHNKKRKVMWYGSIVAQIERELKSKTRRKKSKTKKRILSNGQWVRIKH